MRRPSIASFFFCCSLTLTAATLVSCGSNSPLTASKESGVTSGAGSGTGDWGTAGDPTMGGANGAGNGSAVGLAAPTGLGAQAVSTSEIDLTWSDGTTAYDSVQVSMSQSAAGPFQPWGNPLSGSATSLHVTGLSASTTYYFEITGTASGTTSMPSNVANARTNDPSGSPPPGPLPALGCTVTANPNAVAIQLDAHGNPSAASASTTFTVVANRGATWSGVTGTGGLNASALSGGGTTFTFSGLFFASGNQTVTVTLADPTGGASAQCQAVVSVVGRAAIACQMTVDNGTVNIPIDQNHNPLRGSDWMGVNLVATYPSAMPSFVSDLGGSIVTAPWWINTNIQSKVNFAWGGAGTATIVGTVRELSGASSNSCSTTINVNSVSPSRHVIHQCHHSSRPDWLYTTDPNECTGDGPGGNHYDYDGGAFLAYDQPTAICQTAIYRCVTDVGNFHFLSLFPNCENDPGANFGRRHQEANYGYICLDKTADTGRVLERFRHPNTAYNFAHISTADPNAKAALKNAGWREDQWQDWVP